MQNIIEDKAQEIIDLFFQTAGARVSSKHYQRVLMILNAVATEQREADKAVLEGMKKSHHESIVDCKTNEWKCHEESCINDTLNNVLDLAIEKLI